MREHNFYVLAYDITESRRRVKVARLMESLGARVQGSVFEAYLTPEELEKLVKRVKKILVEQEDSLRIYSLCLACRRKIRMQGSGEVTPPPQVRII